MCLLFLEELYCVKKPKYNSLVTAMENLGPTCQLIVLVFDSLGHIHTVVKVLQKISNYRKRVYLEETMFPLPLNCKTHNGLLNCLHLLAY